MLLCILGSSKSNKWEIFVIDLWPWKLKLLSSRSSWCCRTQFNNNELVKLAQLGHTERGTSSPDSHHLFLLTPVFSEIDRVWGNLLQHYRSLKHTQFLPRCVECRRGLAMRILSVHLSVRLSNACIVTKRKKICLDFYTIRKIIQTSFLIRRMVGGDDPFYLKLWVNRPPLERNGRFWTDIRS